MEKQEEDSLSVPPLPSEFSPPEPIVGASRAALTSQRTGSTYGQYVLVRPTNTNEKGGRIPKEEAVCRVCFEEFGEENAFKLICECPFALIHEHCEIADICDNCGQELKKTPVVLLAANASALKTNVKEVNNCCCC